MTGIGRGAFLDFVGVETPKPITTVRETIEMVRRLWRRDAAGAERRRVHQIGRLVPCQNGTG